MSLDLEAIKSRCEAATPGPWEADGTELFVYQSREWIGECCRLDDPRADRDTTFIAHARDDVPALVAEVERLRDALDFYANPEHWEAKVVAEAPCFGPNAGASEWESGPANDGGNRARLALNVDVSL